ADDLPVVAAVAMKRELVDADGAALELDQAELVGVAGDRDAVVAGVRRVRRVAGVAARPQRPAGNERVYGVHAVVRAGGVPEMDLRHPTDQTGLDDLLLESLVRPTPDVLGDLELDAVTAGGVDHRVGERQGR